MAHARVNIVDHTLYQKPRRRGSNGLVRPAASRQSRFWIKVGTGDGDESPLPTNPAAGSAATAIAALDPKLSFDLPLLCADTVAKRF
jgi:hypothetical protein